MRVYFPNLYDIKYLMGSTDSLNGGLQKVANELKVRPRKTIKKLELFGKMDDIFLINIPKSLI